MAKTSPLLRIICNMRELINLNSALSHESAENQKGFSDFKTPQISIETSYFNTIDHCSLTGARFLDANCFHKIENESRFIREKRQILRIDVDSILNLSKYSRYLWF